MDALKKLIMRLPVIPVMNFLLKKAGVLFLMGNNSEASEILDYLLEINPGNEDAAELKRQTGGSRLYHYRENNYLLAGYYGEFHQEPFSRKCISEPSVIRIIPDWVPLPGKLNFANTFIEGTGLTTVPFSPV
jgi:hypothetical protein